MPCLKSVEQQQPASHRQMQVFCARASFAKTEASSYLSAARRTVGSRERLAWLAGYFMITEWVG
jgi:hypothetical protein